MDKRRLRSVGLASRVNLGAKVGSSGARLGEVAREDGLEEGTEDDLGTTVECQFLFMCFDACNLRGLGKSHPQDENKLESVVEGEPVNGVDSTFKDR